MGEPTWANHSITFPSMTPIPKKPRGTGQKSPPRSSYPHTHTPSLQTEKLGSGKADLPKDFNSTKTPLMDKTELEVDGEGATCWETSVTSPNLSRLPGPGRDLGRDQGSVELTESGPLQGEKEPSEGAGI